MDKQNWYALNPLTYIHINNTIEDQLPNPVIFKIYNHVLVPFPITIIES